MNEKLSEFILELQSHFKNEHLLDLYILDQSENRCDMELISEDDEREMVMNFAIDWVGTIEIDGRTVDFVRTHVDFTGETVTVEANSLWVAAMISTV